jgi:hypothetical protein
MPKNSKKGEQKEKIYIKEGEEFIKPEVLREFLS